MEVQAVSEEGVLRDYIDLRVRLSEAEGEVEVLSSYTDVTVEAGNLFENPLTIWNKGDEDERARGYSKQFSTLTNIRKRVFYIRFIYTISVQ